MIDLEKDPLGAAILAYAQGHREAEITVYSDVAEDDNIPVTHLFRTWEDLLQLEKRAIEECRGHILDVGAGAGCHALILQERGMEVTALEISPAAAHFMGQIGVQRPIQGDIMKFNLGEYDTLLMLMNGIGLVGDLPGLDAFLIRAKTLLRRGGQILFDSSDIRYLYLEDDGAMLVDSEGRYHGEILYQMEFDGHLGPWFKWLFIDFPTLRQIAEEHGFTAELLEEGVHHHYLGRLELR